MPSTLAAGTAPVPITVPTFGVHPPGTWEPTDRGVPASFWNEFLNQDRDTSAQHFGILTIRNCGGWMPAGTNKAPPSSFARIGMYLLSRFALLFNGSPEARQRRQWALVTVRGTMLVLSNVHPDERPEDPAAFPDAVTGGMTQDQAEELVHRANSRRLARGDVREWCVAVVRADRVPHDTEGGDA